MDNKEKYLNALMVDNGRHEEIELGESLNIDEESTRRIINMLLAENKIEYNTHGACSYKVTRKKTSNKKKI